MPSASPWTRLRETRLVQTLVVYLAAAWVAIQAVALFTDAFEWPKWVMRGTITVLAAGLVLALALVWAHMRGRAAEGAPPPRSRPFRVAVVALSLVLVGAALWFVVRDRGRSLVSTAEASAAPGIAILPFSVNDEELARWREGMVDLLATNLDGAGGLRSIDSRTVLARWRDRVQEGETPDLATSLEVARLSGGRFAIVGSVVSSGTNMRVLADVFDVAGGEELGQEMVEGHPDSIFSLVDRLSIAVLGRILEREGSAVPHVDLASITTTSVPALKAFLDAEALARRSDFERAIPAYQASLAADSTFALAAFGLGQAFGWIEGLEGASADSLYARADRFADKLPERDRDALGTALAYTRGERSASERARALAQKYPDDPNAWFLLGEVYFHLPYQTLVPRAETVETFERSVRLDPTYTPAHIHLIDLAFMNADSAALVDLLSRFDELASGTAYDKRYNLGFRLAFGSAAERAAAEAVLDTLPIMDAGRIMGLFQHPRYTALKTRLATAMEERSSDPTARQLLARYLPFLAIQRGRVTEAVRLLEQEETPAPVQGRAAMFLKVVEVEVPEGFYARVFPPDAPDERGFGAALLAIDERRWGDVEAALRGIRGMAAQVAASGDSLTSEQIEAAAAGIEGRMAMARGNDERALSLMEEAYRRTGIPLLPFWIAVIHAEAGRTEQAVRYLETFGADPWVGLRLAPLYEKLGERDKAIEAYGWVTLAWGEADPALQPEVARARQEIARLRGLQRG